MSHLKTNATIKFTSKSEVSKAIDSLVELGYKNDSKWNNDIIFDDEFWILNSEYYIHIYSDSKINIYNFSDGQDNYKNYQSFTEFLND